MWTGTLIAVFLETFVSMIAAAVVSFAKLIMTDSITVFTSGQNVFDTFISLIPFGNIPIGSIVKGIAYCIVVFSTILTSITPTINLIKGEDSSTTINGYLRCAVAALMIGLVFGININYPVAHYDFVSGGLLGQIGSLFGSILNMVPKSANELSIITAPDFSNLFYPFEFLMELVLLVAILIGVVGAALTYVERILSFAVSVIIGPICVAFYANPDTEDTAKNWFMSIFTQFVAILLSLILWNAFIVKLGDAFSSSVSYNLAEDGRSGELAVTLLHYAVALGLLGLVRNSEKILNSFGLRTVSLGDSARMAATGMAATMSAMMIAGRALRGHGRVERETRETPSPYDEKGNLDLTNNRTPLNRSLGTTDPRVYATSLHPQAERMHGVSQLEARNGLFASEGTISANRFNLAYGFDGNSPLKAIGNIQKVSSNVGTKDEIVGFVGDFQYDHNGMSTIYTDCFVLGSHGSDVNYKSLSGTVVGNHQLTSETMPSIDNRGNRLYGTRTTEAVKAEKGTKTVSSKTYDRRQIIKEERRQKKDFAV